MKYYSDHAAYFNDKNEEVPSVTTILKILNKPSLCKWANYLGFKRENVDKVLELKTKKGTAVHELLNSILFRLSNYSEKIKLWQALKLLKKLQVHKVS